MMHLEKAQLIRIENAVIALRDDLRLKQQLNRIELLLTEIRDSGEGMTTEEAESVAARLTAVSDKLNAMSK